MKAKTLQEKLPQISGFDWKGGELVECKKPVHSFIADDVLFISTEHGDNAADYYGEFRGGYPYINPDLVKFAEDRGMHWEWRDPSAIGLYS